MLFGPQAEANSARQTSRQGCLPNHIAGKGAVRTLKKLFENENIVPVDYDPSATRVNQENRIKLMLATARENLKAKQGANK